VEVLVLRTNAKKKAWQASAVTVMMKVSPENGESVADNRSKLTPQNGETAASPKVFPL
jgi:hypothetical protein